MEWTLAAIPQQSLRVLGENSTHTRARVTMIFARINALRGVTEYKGNLGTTDKNADAGD